MSKYFSFLKKKNSNLATSQEDVQKVKRRHAKNTKSEQRHSMHGLTIDTENSFVTSVMQAKSTSDLQDDTESLCTSSINDTTNCKSDSNESLLVEKSQRQKSGEICESGSLPDLSCEGTNDTVDQCIDQDSTERDKTPECLDNDDYKSQSSNSIDSLMDEALDDLEHNEGSSKELPLPNLEVTSEPLSVQNDSETSLCPDDEKVTSSEAPKDQPDLNVDEDVCDQPEFLDLNHSTDSSPLNKPICERSQSQDDEKSCDDSLYLIPKVPEDCEEDDTRNHSMDVVYEMANNIVSETILGAILRTNNANEEPSLMVGENRNELLSLEDSSSETGSSYVGAEDGSDANMNVHGTQNEKGNINKISKLHNGDPPDCKKDEIDGCLPSSADNFVSSSPLDDSTNSIDKMSSSPNLSICCTADSSLAVDNPSTPKSEREVLPSTRLSPRSSMTTSEIEDDFDSAKEDLSDDDHGMNCVISSNDKCKNVENLSSNLIENSKSTERNRGGILNTQKSITDNTLITNSQKERSGKSEEIILNQNLSTEEQSLIKSDNFESVNKSKIDVNGNSGHVDTFKRTISVSEDTFLMQSVNSEFDEAEARLAQRRAARAEARELRLRELEKQQQEHENEEEQQYAANATPCLVPESPVRAPSNSRSSAGRSSVGNSAGSFSRRSSEESDNDPREIKAELKEVEEKFRKAMITNAQLDNEKATLTYEVEFLKDKYSELEETRIQLAKEHKKKCTENEQLRKLTNKLQEEVKAIRKVLQERDALIQEYGLVLIGEENGEDENSTYDAEMEDDTCYDLSPRKIAIKKALLTQEASELLSKGAAKGSLDVRLKKYAEDKNDLEDEVRRLRLELEEQYNVRRKENGLDYEKQKEASKSINEYKFRVQKAEAEVSTLQANVARLESLTARYKASTEELELSEEELKADKRRLQRELRDAQNILEELELKNSLMEKRFDKMRNARSTLLKDLSQDPV